MRINLRSTQHLMRAVIQRVKSAQVSVDGAVVGQIGRGMLVLLGVGMQDTTSDADYLAEKIVHLRIFEDAEGKMNRSLADVGGQALVVSQFTLFGDARRGRRPSYSEAAPPQQANELYQYFVTKVREFDIHVETGVFQAMMDVALINDGPVTILLDSRKLF